MKITRKQLRKIIQEVGIAPGVPQSLTSKLYEAIIDILPMRGAQGLSGAEVVEAVQEIHPEIDAETIYSFLDTLLEDRTVNFDAELDEWSLRTR